MFINTAALIAYSISLPKAKFLQCIDITSLQLPITIMNKLILATISKNQALQILYLVYSV